MVWLLPTRHTMAVVAEAATQVDAVADAVADVMADVVADVVAAMVAAEVVLGVTEDVAGETILAFATRQ